MLLACAPLLGGAGELTPEHAWQIYQVAYGQIGGPREWLDKPHMPTIYIVPEKELCALIGERPGCGAQGAYVNGTKQVYIDAALDFRTLYATTVLLHEMVHHFQFLKRGKPTACAEFESRERQAYLIQADMLERGGEYAAAYQVAKSGLMRVHCKAKDDDRAAS
jgi:hypothetical protein